VEVGHLDGFEENTARNPLVVHEPDLRLVRQAVVPEYFLPNRVRIIRIWTADGRRPRIDDTELVAKSWKWIGGVSR
jgi:hypothetical protein